MTSATRRPAFAARVAMQKRYSNVEQLYNLVSSQVTTDAGLMMDRARYLKDANWETPARQLFARGLWMRKRGPSNGVKPHTP